MSFLIDGRFFHDSKRGYDIDDINEAINYGNETSFEKDDI